MITGEDLKGQWGTVLSRHIEDGERKHTFFTKDVDEAFTNNPFEQNYYFYSDPGYGKTHQVKEVVDKHGIDAIQFDGSLGVFAFAADLAYTLMHAPKGNKKIAAVFDDCDSIFEKGDPINTVKGMFDPKRQTLTYGKALTGSNLSSLDEEQLEAIMSFKVPGKSGFSIPTDRFTFVTLSNRPLASSVDIDSATDSQKQIARDQNAIRRRVEYKDLSLDTDVKWGYIAHVTMNYPLCENAINNMRPVTEGEKIELLDFIKPGIGKVSGPWDKISERNLSVVEKMTRDMIRYPKEYKDKWATDYFV
jgi:hypothetical protein